MNSEEKAEEMSRIASDTFNYIMQETEDYEYSRSASLLIMSTHVG